MGKKEAAAFCKLPIASCKNRTGQNEFLAFFGGAAAVIHGYHKR